MRLELETWPTARPSTGITVCVHRYFNKLSQHFSTGAAIAAGPSEPMMLPDIILVIAITSGTMEADGLAAAPEVVMDENELERRAMAHEEVLEAQMMLTLSARTEAMTARATDIARAEQAEMRDELVGALMRAEAQQDSVRSEYAARLLDAEQHLDAAARQRINDVVETEAEELIAAGRRMHDELAARTAQLNVANLVHLGQLREVSEQAESSIRAARRAEAEVNANPESAINSLKAEALQAITDAQGAAAAARDAEQAAHRAESRQALRLRQAESRLHLEASAVSELRAQRAEAAGLCAQVVVRAAKLADYERDFAALRAGSWSRPEPPKPRGRWLAQNSSALPTGARRRRPLSADVARRLDLKRVAKFLQLVKVVLLPVSRKLARELGLLLIPNVFLETKPGLPAHMRSASLSSSSDEGDIRRRKGAVKELKLDPSPQASGPRRRIQSLCSKVCAASKRSKRRTLRWLQLAEDPAVTWERLEHLSSVQRKWGDLDTALADSTLQFATVSLERQLLTYQGQLTARGHPLSGRCALKMFFEQFRIESGQKSSIDVTTFVNLRFHGDLEAYLDMLDYILMGLTRQPDEELIVAIVEPQLRLCRDLAPTFVAFDGAEEGSEERAISWPYNRAWREVAREKRVAASKQLQDAVPKKIAAPGAGKGGKGDTGKGKAAEKKKKAAEKKKASAAAGRPDVAQDKPLCAAFQKSGKCDKGDKCEFRHAPKATAKAAPARVARHADEAAGATGVAMPSATDNDAEWAVADTGVGDDLLGAQTAVQFGDAHHRTDLHQLATANGTIAPDTTAVVGLERLGEDTEAVVLPGRINALSIGRRCAEYGYTFTWNPFEDKPVRLAPDGTPLDVRVDHYVPMVVAVAPETAGLGDDIWIAGDPSIVGGLTTYDQQIDPDEIPLKCGECLPDDAMDATFRNDPLSRGSSAPLPMDHVEMERGSDARRAAPYALNITDEGTGLFSSYPAVRRDASAVLDSVRRFEDTPEKIKRWWGDHVPEFRAAARQIREQRTLARYRSTPYRPQANGKAERMNRLSVEGTRALLHQSGFSESWWPLAIRAWATAYNVWERAPCTVFPFGGLVTYRPPAGSKTTKAELKHLGSTKWKSRLVPAVFVGVAAGPGETWAKSYLVVPLAAIMDDGRASRVSVRTVTDVVFPDQPAFPLKQRLMAHGAFEDLNLPAPIASDDIGAPGELIVTEDACEDDAERYDLTFDGDLSENAPHYSRKKRVMDIMMALDPDSPTVPVSPVPELAAEPAPEASAPPPRGSGRRPLPPIDAPLSIKATLQWNNRVLDVACPDAGGLRADAVRAQVAASPHVGLDPQELVVNRLSRHAWVPVKTSYVFRPGSLCLVELKAGAAPPTPADDPKEDFWEREDGLWHRVHVVPRVAMFTPIDVDGAPDADELGGWRLTKVDYHNGQSDLIEDDWLRDPSPHRPLHARWTGRTTFGPKDQEEIDAEGGNFLGSLAPPPAPVDADLAELAQPAPVAAIDAEVVPGPDRAPPAGWGRDDFGADGVVRGSVWAPPWSTRPPAFEPEVWMSLNAANRLAARNAWKADDPVGSAAQEARRKAWAEHKSKKAKPAGPAPRVLCSCTGFVGGDLESDYVGAPGARPSMPARRSVEAALPPQGPAAPADPSDAGRVLAPKSKGQLCQQAFPAILSGDFDELFIELCCTENSKLSEHAPRRTLATRVTTDLDFTDTAVLKHLKHLARSARKHKVRVAVWSAIPCTAGCPWKHVNESKGIKAGDPELTEKLISHGVALCRHVRNMGQLLFGNGRPLPTCGRTLQFRRCAMGLTRATASSPTSKVVWTRKKWCIYSTDAHVRTAFSAFTSDPHEDQKEFVWCRGKFAKESAIYTDTFARTFWLARGVVSRPAAPGPRFRSFFKGCAPEASGADHRGHDASAPPSRPFWCAMVTRVVKPRGPEANCDEARAAIAKERSRMHDKGVWDESDVHSLRDLLRDPKLAEAMFGRVFAILGIKGEELSKEHQQLKARAVFQGSNVRTKTGSSAAELFEEVADAPASFAAGRAAIAAGVLKGFDNKLRDAESAYLQAPIDSTSRVPTFVELPEARWPDSWCFDGSARKKPKYTRPHCRLIKALYGHPEAGALWEAKLDSILRQRLWGELEKHVSFKEPEADLDRYVGAHYDTPQYDSRRPHAPRPLVTNMSDYVKNAVKKFVEDVARTAPQMRLGKVTSPFVSPEQWADPGAMPGAFATTAASYVATVFFLSRVARPDISVAVQRLCPHVTKWSTTHDVAVVRSSDADWAGDAETTRSTSGLFLELFAPTSEHSWPLSWASQTQTATSSATAESETLAMSKNVRMDALPMADMLAKMGAKTNIVVLVDNTQAIAAVERGYSKKLRHLERAHKCAISVVHELWKDGEIEVEHRPTATHKGDGFTMALLPAKFIQARELMNI
ncbi:unnamed protein product, partial [Prorocentrum cordatum]